MKNFFVYFLSLLIVSTLSVYSVQAESEDLSFDELPVTAQEYISENYPNFAIEEIEMEDGMIEVELESGVELEFNAEGELVSIEEDKNEDEDSYEYSEEDEDEYNERMEKKQELQERFQSLRDEGRIEIRMNRDEAKENREEFRIENKDTLIEIKKSLNEETLEALEEIKAEYKEEMSELKEELKEVENDEQRAELLEEMRELAMEKTEAINELVGENEEAIILIEKRKEVFEINEELREENREIRKNYEKVKRESVMQYRTAFLERIGDKLDGMEIEKLEKVSEKIDTMLEKYETKTGITSTKREAFLAALMALKEIVEEKIEAGDVEADVLETVEALLEE